MIFYGTFKNCNKYTSDSNYFFDNSLKMQNDLCSIKNLEEVREESKKTGFLKRILLVIISMLANNFSII